MLTQWLPATCLSISSTLAWCRRPGRPGRVNRMLASPGNTQVRMLWQVVMRGGRGGHTHQPAYSSRAGPSWYIETAMAYFTEFGQKFTKKKALKKMVCPGQSINIYKITFRKILCLRKLCLSIPSVFRQWKWCVANNHKLPPECWKLSRNSKNSSKNVT